MTRYSKERHAEAPRLQTRELPVEKRRGSFDEVELTLDEETIREECKRCLRCDLEWLETMELEPVSVLEGAVTVPLR